MTGRNIQSGALAGVGPVFVHAVVGLRALPARTLPTAR